MGFLSKIYVKFYRDRNEVSIVNTDKRGSDYCRCRFVTFLRDKT
jgi:hypothetical protein